MTPSNRPDASMPRLATSGPCTQLIVDGQPFIMLGGEVHNSSSSSLEYMEASYNRAAAVGCNTVLLPVSWELIEPQEGVFDFGLVDGLLAGARSRNLRLVFLWFGTWKNAMSTYVPEWVKTDLERFPRAHTAPGHRSGAISCMSRQACQADSRAFAAFMRHLREVDSAERTVIMVQVENETGLLGAERDLSPEAEAAFHGQVPAMLTEYLSQHADSLLPDVRAWWDSTGRRSGGSWTEVFGIGAAEAFMAWHVASYVDAVAAAGKAEYPLPMFANAWLVQYPGQPPGAYPSGGPVAKVMDIWRAAAPHIDLLAPDIYLPTFAAVCREYHTAGNPLLIPEAHVRMGAANAFYAIAQHDAICFSPFGIDGRRETDDLAATYALLGGMLPTIAQYQGTGRMVGVLQEDRGPAVLELGGYRLEVRYNRAEPADALPARGLIISPADGEYLVAGAGFSVHFSALPGMPRNVEFLAVDEGTFRANQWVPGRRLNGDELGVRMGDSLAVCRARLHSFD